jgi:hypothetical protein
MASVMTPGLTAKVAATSSDPQRHRREGEGHVTVVGDPELRSTALVYYIAVIELSQPVRWAPHSTVRVAHFYQYDI